ncbi:hypothetical protein COCNU_07G009540 [Cocos nucifera]|uniref:Glycosyltransferase family 28 N-terminal domain-containing protein n=1 Tax=Cocos nucifera TaxID=13894 RepID=A0A8K0IG55_COCNU|nr:hypothetical protein COCNU_07G009540 [Cocos nucifera]
MAGSGSGTEASNGNGSSSSPSVIINRNLPRASTMPGGMKNTEKSETSSGQHNWERSKTERCKQSHPCDHPAAQLFDDKISVKMKLKMLNQIATVKDDGTVEFDVPSSLEHMPVDTRSEDVAAEPVDEELLDSMDFQYRPPMQIVILIVGTRGDAQPFVAIGKRLQLSYHIVDLMIWLGIRDIINDFRKRKLQLRPITYLSGAQGSASDIPHGYIWSPHLVPKPKDWGPKIDVVGFCFLDLASNYEPPESLVKWLESGEKPIYIGFGSLVSSISC